jgi:hypothetical protein
MVKRRRYVVKEGMQYALVLYMLLVTLAVVAFHTLIAYWRISAAAKLVGDAPLASLFAEDVIITVLFMVFLVVVVGIRGTHKVAGPIFRFEETIKKIQKGDISDQIQLRKGDLLLEFGENLNLALANLREIAAEDRMAAIEAARLVLEVQGKTGVQDIRARLQRAADLMARIGMKLTLDPEWRRKAGMTGERAILARMALGDVAPAPIVAPPPIPAAPSAPTAPVAGVPAALAGGFPRPNSTMAVPPPPRAPWVVDKTLPGERPAPGAALPLGFPAYLERAKTTPDPIPSPGGPPMPR